MQLAASMSVTMVIGAGLELNGSLVSPKVSLGFAYLTCTNAKFNWRKCENWRRDTFCYILLATRDA